MTIRSAGWKARGSGRIEVGGCGGYRAGCTDLPDSPGLAGVAAHAAVRIADTRRLPRPYEAVRPMSTPGGNTNFPIITQRTVRDHFDRA